MKRRMGGGFAEDTVQGRGFASEVERKKRAGDGRAGGILAAGHRRAKTDEEEKNEGQWGGAAPNEGRSGMVVCRE